MFRLFDMDMEKPMDWLDHVIYTVFGAVAGGGLAAYGLYDEGKLNLEEDWLYIAGCALIAAILSGLYGFAFWKGELRD